MSRIRTSFQPGLEKLGDRLCLSGTPLEPIDFTAAPTAEFGGHVKAFSGVTSAEVSAYGGYLGGIRVACGDVDHTDLGNDWISGGTGRDAASVSTSAALHLKPLVGTSAEQVDRFFFDAASSEQAVPSATDDNNHGTHVAGTIGAVGHSSGANFAMLDGSVRSTDGDDLTVEESVDQQAMSGREYQHYTITLTNAAVW